MPASFRFSTSPTNVPHGGQPLDRAPMRPFFFRTRENPSSSGSIPCETAVATLDLQKKNNVGKLGLYDDHGVWGDISFHFVRLGAISGASSHSQAR